MPNLSNKSTLQNTVDQSLKSTSNSLNNQTELFKPDLFSSSSESDVSRKGDDNEVHELISRLKQKYWGKMERAMDSFLKTGKISKEDTPKPNVKDIKPSAPPKPWVEKYRPKTVDDVVEQTEIVSVLKQVLAGADLPHFLFYGPPGTGKTSTILAAARELFGTSYRDRILELNASDDRGIQVIRDKVKSFAQLTASSVKPDGSPCPPYKIVILDEADSMTNAAQAALRRTMEKETKTTRFCLICNYVSSIIEPLTSRCMKFRFKPLGAYMVQSRLEMICREEGVKFESKAIAKLVDICEGDLRQAITLLQSCARLKGNDTITDDDIIEIGNLVPDKLVVELLETCKTGVYKDIENVTQLIIYEAFPSSQILTQLHKIIISSPDISDTAKSLMSESIAECSARLQSGASEYVQMLNLGCSIADIFANNEKGE